MRYPASEKAEIIQLVEQSHLPFFGNNYCHIDALIHPDGGCRFSARI